MTRKLAHSLESEIYKRPVYEPYVPNQWRIGVRIVADLVFIVGLFLGIVLALAGHPFQVVAVVCLVVGLALEGALWLTEGE